MKKALRAILVATISATLHLAKHLGLDAEDVCVDAAEHYVKKRDGDA